MLFRSGLTTDQLKANTSLSGFDFTNTWDVIDNGSYVSYPYLRDNQQNPEPGLGTAEGILASCQEIASSGVYTLVQNLTSSSTCIEITADDVTFDGGKNEIEADGVSSSDEEYGVYINGAENVTVTNVTVTGWGQDISASSTEGMPLTEEEKRLKDRLTDGSVSSESIRAESTQTASSGILYDGTNTGDVKNILARNNYHGVALDEANNNNVTDSTMNSNRRYVPLLRSEERRVGKEC